VGYFWRHGQTKAALPRTVNGTGHTGRAAPTSIKKLIFAVAASVFVLGAVFATFVAPKSTIAHRVLTEENLDVINGTSYKSYFDFDLHPCNVWGCHGPFQGRALP